MKALDSWARQFGYADFDTYTRAGGSLEDVRRDIGKRIRNLQIALDALNFTEPAGPASAPKPEPIIDPAILARLERDATDEPPDPNNAHVQGADG